MRSLPLWLLLAGLLCVSTAARGATPPPAIEQLRQRFERAYDAGNARAIADLVTEDARWLAPGEPPTLGRAAVQQRYAAQFAKGPSTFRMKIDDFRESGELAFLQGSYQREDTGAGGVKTHFSGKYLMVLARQPDGSWRIARDIWNGDVPPGAELSVDAEVALNDFRALVEERLESALRTFGALAQTREVQSAEWNAMLPLLRSASGAGLPASAVWFARPDGSYSTVEGGPARAKLSDRPYFPGLMAGKPVLGALVISRSTKKRSIVVAAPVRREGRVVGAVGASLSMEALGKALDAQMRLPAGIVFYALDAKGQTALHRDPALMMAMPSDMGSPSLRASVHEMLTRPRGVVRYTFRGVPKTVLYERSPRLGWVFALGFQGRPSAGR